jgi:hypothetical protein
MNFPAFMFGHSMRVGADGEVALPGHRLVNRQSMWPRSVVTIALPPRDGVCPHLVQTNLGEKSFSLEHLSKPIGKLCGVSHEPAMSAGKHLGLRAKNFREPETT